MLNDLATIAACLQSVGTGQYDPEMKYLLGREMMSAAASISTATALRSQIKLDGRFWHRTAPSSLKTNLLMSVVGTEQTNSALQRLVRNRGIN
jgi:hypothetical protein